MARIAVVGAGYVGLVTAAGFAAIGHRVSVLETDAGRLASLRRGQVPIHEPGLAELVAKGRDAGRLEFGDDYGAVIPRAEFAVLAVNTPASDDGTPDTTFLFSAVRTILRHARAGLTIVTKSTVPVGTADDIDRLIDAAGVEGVDVVSNPEFLREGSAIDDFLRPDRVVVGATGHAIGRRVGGLYDALHAPVQYTGRRSAELAKYAANAALAARISFINEIAAISAAVGADIRDVARIVGADRRIGPRFLEAGLGWGGSCFPKDVTALAATADRYAVEVPVLEATIAVNQRQRSRAVDVLLGAARGRPDATVGVLGLAFKPNTDDVRGSPALDVIGRLLAAGVRVRAHDPHAMAAARAADPDLTLAADAYDAARGADVLLLATEWDEYLELDWPRIAAAMRGRLVLDGRNVLDGAHLAGLGFEYHAYGRTNEGHAHDRAAPPQRTGLSLDDLAVVPSHGVSSV